MARKVFNVYDNTKTPPRLVGSPSTWDTHAETAEDAARRRARAQLGHDNFTIEEVKETAADKAGKFLDRMAEYFKDV
jgi:hypothetical protein